MLTEGLVAIMALVAATTLAPADYFLINGVPKVVHALGIQPVQLSELTRLVGEETLQGRTGGAVSLAVGMANILRQIPGMGHLMAYWYHFAIMFEAVFILTALDTGTRVARYLFQDVAGRVWAPLGSTTNFWSVGLVGALVCFCWGYLMATGSVETIWPLFGVSNQLLAVIALAVGTSFLLRQRPPAYALTTFLPLCFLTVTTMTAGVLNTFRYLSPAYIADKGPFVSYLDGILSIVLLLLVGTILVDAVRRWGVILAERRRGLVEVPLRAHGALKRETARAWARAAGIASLWSCAYGVGIRVAEVADLNRQGRVRVDRVPVVRAVDVVVAREVDPGRRGDRARDRERALLARLAQGDRSVRGLAGLDAKVQPAGHRGEDPVVVGDRVAGHDDLGERRVRFQRRSAAVRDVAERHLDLVDRNERVQRIDDIDQVAEIGIAFVHGYHRELIP